MKKVAIVIPYYTNSLNPKEKISINYLEKNLKRYDKFLVIPENLSEITLKIAVKIERFPSEYFTSTKMYSKLLCQSFFYERFSKYDYILIYQLDALVLKDELRYWCSQGYDYVGAPLFNSVVGKLTSDNSVGGNGGFSLRKVSSAIKVIKNAEMVANRSSESSLIQRFWFIIAVFKGISKKIWLNAPPSEYPYNEDGFWSFEANKYYKKFKQPSFKTALKFSFERFPEKCFKYNSGKLPFGCHAWDKYNPDFWKKHLG